MYIVLPVVEYARRAPPRSTTYHAYCPIRVNFIEPHMLVEFRVIFLEPQSIFYGMIHNVFRVLDALRSGRDGKVFQFYSGNIHIVRFFIPKPVEIGISLDPRIKKHESQQILKLRAYHVPIKRVREPIRLFYALRSLLCRGHIRNRRVIRRKPDKISNSQKNDVLQRLGVVFHEFACLHLFELPLKERHILLCSLRHGVM